MDMKKLLLLLFSLMISSNSYSETLICSSINTTFKNIDPILVVNRFTKNGNIYEKEDAGIYEIYYEDDQYLILDNNLGLIGGTAMFYLDKQSKEFFSAVQGVGVIRIGKLSSTLSQYTAEGKCEVVN